MPNTRRLNKYKSLEVNVSYFHKRVSGVVITSKFVAEQRPYVQVNALN